MQCLEQKLYAFYMKKATSFQRKVALFAMCALSLCLLTTCVKEISLGSVQGIVTDATTNEPIQGVNISLSPTGLSAVTGSDGRYEFKNLEAGQYTVQASAEGYETNTKNITIVQGNFSQGDMTLKREIAGIKLSVEYLDFGTNFSQLSFKITNTSNSLSVNWNISESVEWLGATPTSGNLGPGKEVAVLVTVDRSQIQQSTTANLTVTGADQSIVLPINVSVSGTAGPKLNLSETALDFGTTATNLYFFVKNEGPAGTSLNWTISNTNADWLMLTPTSGNTDGGNSSPVMVTIDRSKIEGMVSTSVTVSGAGASKALTISASSEGAGAAILQLSEGSLNFGETENTKTFLVQNVGSSGTVLDWTIVPPGVDWLTLTPMSGSTNANSSTLVTAVVDRDKFNGVVTTNITVSGSSNSGTISVTAANVHAVMEVSTGAIDFGTIETTKTITIKNVGDEGSTLQWSIATPPVNWVKASPMAGTIYYNQTAEVTITIDRTLFVGNLTTAIQITGANSTPYQVNITADNSVVVTDGLYAYFPFDSEEIVDWGGNFTGLNYGALLSNDTPSGEGHSMQFDGETSYIYIPDNIIPGGVPYTINFWFKTGRNDQTFFGTKINTNYGPRYRMGLTGNACVFIHLANHNEWTSSNPITAYVNNQWHMLTFTYNGTTANYYIDGVLLETVSTGGLHWANGLDAFYFGKHFNTSVYYGKLDNFRSYNRALTQDEIRSIYNAKQ